MKTLLQKIIFTAAVFVFMLAGAVKAADPELTGAVFTWKNMGLMGPGDESGQYISLTRVSEIIQHSIEYHGGPIVQKIILYITEDEARFLLLDVLGDAAKGWASHYKGNIVDGSSWRVVLHYANGTAREFDGYGKVPPYADEIKEQLLKLVSYEIVPKLF